MPGRLTVSGAKELQRALDALADEMATGFALDAAKAGAAVVAAAARARAPRRTGRLADSLRVLDEIDIGDRGATAFAGTPVGYAGLVEFGTRFALAKPYLRPAADENHEAILSAQVDSLTDNINNLTRRHR